MRFNVVFMKMDVPPLSTYKQKGPTSFNFSIKHFASFCNKYLYHVCIYYQWKPQWLPQRFLTNFWESPAQMKSDSDFFFCLCTVLYFSSVSTLYRFYFLILTLPFYAQTQLYQECFFNISACTSDHRASELGNKTPQFHLGLKMKWKLSISA